ncbi:MAG: response regulator transcription factor [Dehalococcoidia bacterium]
MERVHATKVLVVEDDEAMSRLISATLKSEGYDVVNVTTAAAAIEAASRVAPDVIVLDMMLPDGSGADVIREVMRRGHARVLCLTAVAEGPAIVEALKAGATDYITKPFNPEELCARVRAVLRRAEGAPIDERVVRTGDVEIDLTRRLVKKAGKVVQFSGTEWKLLFHLAKNPERTLQNAELLLELSGPAFTTELQYLRVWISRIRKKLETNPGSPEIIETLPGIGYRLNVLAPRPGDDPG